MPRVMPRAFSCHVAHAAASSAEPTAVTPPLFMSTACIQVDQIAPLETYEGVVEEEESPAAAEASYIY